MELADLAERAARLAKADLVTGMVGEFPELQGVIGGYLAEAQGEPQAVADAVRDHYKPLGQMDDVPTAPVTVAVALADKLDTLAAFFTIGELPTGSKDPYALRRAALGAITTLIAGNLKLPLRQYPTAWLYACARALSYEEFRGGIILHDKPMDELLLSAGEKAAIDLRMREEFQDFSVAIHYYGEVDDGLVALEDKLLNFFADRLKVQQREAGVRHDLIDAVFALGGEDDLVRLLARVNALQQFIETEDGADLLTAYKRAANILKKENWAGTSASGGPDVAPQEQALISALDTAEPKASTAIDAEDFTAAMAALATLRRPIDEFFDHVTVNDPDAAKRERRLNLLMRFRDAVNRVADFSRIEG